MPQLVNRRNIERFQSITEEKKLIDRLYSMKNLDGPGNNLPTKHSKLFTDELLSVGPACYQKMTTFTNTALTKTKFKAAPSFTFSKQQLHRMKNENLIRTKCPGVGQYNIQTKALATK